METMAHIRRWVGALLLAVMTVLGMGAMVAIPAMADPVATVSPSADPSENPTDGETEPPEPVQPEQQEEEKNTDTYSLYGLASSMASVFANTQNPEALAAKVSGGSSGGGEESGDGSSGEAADGKVGFDIEVWSTTLSSPGSAGSFLAYPDSELSENSGWLFQNYARNAVRPGYDSLVAQFSMPGGQGGSSSPSSHSVKEYAYFGAAVKSLGLDSTTTIVAGGGPGLLKTSMASILSIAYLVSSGIDTVFATAINILQALNPFRLFAKGVASAFGGTGSQAAAIVGSEGQPPAAVASLVNFLGSTYSFVRGMGIFILLPMMIVIALFSFAMMSQRRKSSGARGRIAKDLIVRIVFWAVGIPMMGFAYTGVLDSVEDTLKPQGGTTNVVTSTFVDYGSWATNNRYAIPKGAKIEYDVKSREATVDSQVNVRDTARKINKEAAGIGSDGIKFLDSNKGFVLASDGPAWNPSESVKANRLILDYIKGTTVSADEFASYMQKDATAYALQFDETDKKREYPKLWYSAVRDLAKKDKMVSGDGGAVGAPSPGTEASNPEDMEGDELLRHVGIKNNPLINISGQGLIASEGKDTYEFESYSTGCKGTGSKNGRALLNSAKDASPRSCNMSPVATYNMLMTDFGGDSATVFSGAQTSTTNSTINHHKVNLVGTGAAQELYLANSMVSLASIAFLGILFAGAMIIGSFKRYGPLIFSVIGSQLGLVGIMGRLIGYTVALILEVLVTLGIYVMVQELIIALPKLIESPITALTKNVGNASGSSMITSGFAAAGGSSTTGAHMLGIGFIIVIQILFFVTALKSRSKVLNAANAAIDSLLSKLLGARVSTAGSGTAGTAGAAIGGAGLLAAGAMGGGGGLLGSPSAADGAAEASEGGAVLGEGQQAGPEAADNAQDGGVMEAGPIGMDTSESDAAGNESFNANPGEQDAQGLNTDDASADAAQDANAAGLQDENAAALAGGDVSGQAADADAQMSQGADSDADSAGGAMVRDAQREGTAAEMQDANSSGGGVGLQADGSMVDKAGATTAAFAPGEHGGPAEAAAQENAENRALQSQEGQKALAGAEGSGISAEGAQAAGVDHPSQTASFDAAAGPLGESMAASADRAQVQGMDATGATGGESLDSASGTSGVGQMGADGSTSDEIQLGSGHDAQTSQSGQQGISDDGSRVSTISDVQSVSPQGFENATGATHDAQPMGDSQFAAPDSQAEQIAAARIAEQTEALHQSFFSGGMAASLGDMGGLLKENMSAITSQMRGDNTGE